MRKKTEVDAGEILTRADALRSKLDTSFRDQIVRAIFTDAEDIARRSIKRGRRRYKLDERIDRTLTSPITGLPIMLIGLVAIFWITVTGANYPSQVIATALFWVEEKASHLFTAFGAPWWLTGFLWHGVYRGLAWVISVMLPPMAIFFPIFTILEDLGFLPRVAFNMDRLFRKAGAHGKQALTMSMGFGCNAAGVISCRIIDSPRERFIAILTNTFVPCNGRFPTLIVLATIFVGGVVPPAFASIAAAGAVVGIVVLGLIVTLAVSWILSRTVLRGEASAFTLELPSYRRPSILRILYTSLIDRTLFVLYRAMIIATPAGGLIWLLSNINAGGQSLTMWISGFLNPFGVLLGLDGVILLAYIIAIPANEIVVPTILMAYMNSSRMIELESLAELKSLLVGQEGWTLITAICLMLFSLLHYPCSTTIWTIWKEIRSTKWTAFGALMPLSLAILICFIVAQGARLLF
jgi:ferrous iron transport protein B